MKQLLWGIRFYSLMVGYKYKAFFAYQGWSAAFSLVGMMCGYFAGLSVIWARMRVFPSLGGYTFWEVVLLYSLELLSYSFANTIMRLFWNTQDLILKGDLDMYLLWPCRPILGVSARFFEAGYAGHITLAIILTILAANQLNLHWGMAGWLLFAAGIAGGTGIYIGFTSLPAILTFWVGDTENLTDIFRFGFRDIIYYPLAIYPQAVRILLTFILPYAFITYYPSLDLLGKNNGSVGYIFLAVCVGAFMVFLTAAAWTRGLKRYESAGG
jgi:ABC-2 type transport system permease protein